MYSRGGESVPRHGRIDLRDEHRREQRQCPSHAVATDADLRSRTFQILDGSPDILRGGVGEVEVLHQVLSFGSFEPEIAPIEVWNQRAKSSGGILLGHALDLFVDAPPLLDNDEPGGGGGIGGLCVKGGAGAAAIRTCECDRAHASHYTH